MRDNGMRDREEILKILYAYITGELTIEAFCYAFDDIYYYENGACNRFTGEEKVHLDRLGTATSRFSPYDSDHKENPGTFFNEEDVRENALDVLNYYHMVSHD